MKFNKRLLSLVGFIGLAVGVCAMVNNPIKAHRLSSAYAPKVIFLGGPTVNKEAIVDRIMCNPHFYETPDGQILFNLKVCEKESLGSLVACSVFNRADVAVFCYNVNDDESRKDVGYFVDIVKGDGKYARNHIDGESARKIKCIAVGDLANLSESEKRSVDCWVEIYEFDKLNKRLNLPIGSYIYKDLGTEEGLRDLVTLLKILTKR